MDTVDWDQWLPDGSEGFYSSAGWLELMRDTEGFEDRLLVGRDAVLPLGVAATGSTNPLYDLGASSEPSPQTVLGTHSGYANEPIVRGDDALAEWGRLVERARTEVPGDWVGMPFLRPSAARRVAPYLGGHVVVRAAGRCELAVDFDSVEGYLETLSGSRRSMARRDMKAFRAGGSSVEVGPLAPAGVPELAPLLANVQHRHGSQVDLGAVTEFLRTCALSTIAADSVAFVCRKDGEAIAFSLWFRFRSTLMLRVVGLDYERVAEHKEYFTVLVHAPLRYALDAAISTIDFGTEGFRAKLMRGAAYVPQVTVLLRTPPDFTPEQARRRDERFLAELETEVGDLLDVRSLSEVEHAPA